MDEATQQNAALVEEAAAAARSRWKNRRWHLNARRWSVFVLDAGAQAFAAKAAAAAVAHAAERPPKASNVARLHKTPPKSKAAVDNWAKR